MQQPQQQPQQQQQQQRQKQKQSGGGGGKPAPGGGAGPRLCFRCNQPGHFIAQCPYELQAQAHANIARP
ncbi:unnamed protein product, partial [Laminaria digitata]